MGEDMRQRFRDTVKRQNPDKTSAQEAILRLVSQKRPDTVGEVVRLAESGISWALASPPEPCHVALKSA
jgi:hypothetical protein